MEKLNVTVVSCKCIWITWKYDQANWKTDNILKQLYEGEGEYSPTPSVKEELLREGTGSLTTTYVHICS